MRTIHYFYYLSVELIVSPNLSFSSTLSVNLLYIYAKILYSEISSHTVVEHFRSIRRKNKKKMRNSTFLIFFAACVLLPASPIIDGAKILSIFPFPGPSQYIFASGLLKELARRGHEVTSISVFPQQKPLKNFRDIEIPENKGLFDGCIL